MDQTHLKRAGTVATVILGNILYAFVIRLFLLPGNLMTGGTTGIGLVVKHFTGASISGFVLVFNIVMLLVGWTLLGKKFALTTVDFRIKQMNERIEESKKLASGEIKPEVKKSDEEAVELMRSVLGLTTTISNVNLPNRGQISWLPEGSIVETNAVFSNDRVVPVTTKPLPVAVQSLVRRCSDNIDILYEGIKKRDKKIIFESFVNQPLCSSLTLDEARSLFDEMYEKNLRFFQKNN